MKFNWTIAAYGAAGIAAAYIAYKLYKDLVTNPFGKLSTILDEAAESSGLRTATAALMPNTLYITARSAFSKSQGLTDGGALPASLWPAYEDWINGQGPQGFTYGSANYPKPETPSILDSIFSSF